MANISLLILLLLFLTQQASALSVGEFDDKVDLKNITAFPDDYNFTIRAGYLNITPFNQAFYYIFCESQRDPVNDPVILWLNGGPGCSSLTGFLTQIGPFLFKEEDPTKMYNNPYAWNKKANVWFLESPGRVGFSYSSATYQLQNDTSVAKDNLKAIIMFFDRYPYLRDNDFYIAGESYAGIYIPRLAEEILSFNDGMQDTHINLRGILIGNGCTHPYECYTNTNYSRFTTQFWHSRGFIEDQEWSQYQATCLDSESSVACKALQKTIATNFINTGANIYNIYGKCYYPKYPPKIQESLDSLLTHQPLTHPLRCTDAIGPLTLLNKNQYRLALKINEYNDTLFWTPCTTLNYTVESKATYSTLPTLVAAGLKIIYFTGDQDAIVPITGSLYWFEKYRVDYGMSIKKSWRPWVTASQNISGMVWELEGLTLATVRGAGHMVPSDKPAQAEQILKVMIGENDKTWVTPDYFIE